MRYQFIEEHRADYPVTLLCRVMQVTRSGYYAWRNEPLSLRKVANLVLLQQNVATSHYLTFKSDAAPFDDVRLRQAVSMALDRQSLVDHTLYGFGEAGVSVITTQAKDWVRTDIAPAYDMEAARALAGEALQGERVEARLVLNSGLLGQCVLPIVRVV